MPGGIRDWRVAVVDDAINAGTAVAACLAEIRAQHAVPVAVAALLSLAPANTRSPASLPFYAAGALPSQTWPASQCPLCNAGILLTDR